MNVRTGARVEQLGERVSRQLASRFSRRSFIGSVGRGSIVLTLGGGAFAARASIAGAHANPCAEGLSVSCHQLTGQNVCPSGTCGCGYWELCGQPECAANYAMRWRDCCVTDAGWCEGRRRCVNNAPSCYHHKEYPQGCRNNIGAIRCRAWQCVYNAKC